METEALKGFVLASYPVRERDAYLKILTASKGMVSVFASRIRQAAQANHALAGLYQLVNLQVKPRRTDYWLLEGEVVASFPRLQSEIFLQAMAAHLAQLIQELLIDPLASDALPYELTAYAFHHLNACQDHERAQTLLCLAQLRLLAWAGYQLDQAAMKPQHRGTGWRLTLGHDEEAQKGRMPTFVLTPGAQSALLTLQQTPPNRLFQAQMDPGVADQLKQFARHYVAVCLDQEDRQHAYLDQLLKFEDWAHQLNQIRRQQRSEPDTPTRSDSPTELSNT